MTVITTTADLEKFCAPLHDVDFITVDTEFLREKTYYPKLCLIQIAGPDPDHYAAVDPLADDIDLSCLWDLFDNTKVMKVLHAARQDLEIFVNLTGRVPHPLFDTQVAGMVCGYGDQVGYDALVKKVLGVTIDKSRQFTDWSHRPLSNAQIDYALKDVTYLRDVYIRLQTEIADAGRASWVEEEEAVLFNTTTYQTDPDTVWQKIKIKSDRPKVLGILREIAAWREREAMRLDVPKGRILKDDTLCEIAFTSPKNPDELARVRNFPRGLVTNHAGATILAAVKKVHGMKDDELPQVTRGKPFPDERKPTLELLKMLLRIRCAEEGVAAKLVAGQDDLEKLALDDDADIAVMKGWRYEVFGKMALDMKHGKIALGLSGSDIKIHKIPA